MGVVVLTVEAPVSAGQDKRVVSQGLEGGRSGWIVRDRRGWYARGGTKGADLDMAQAAGVL